MERRLTQLLLLAFAAGVSLLAARALSPLQETMRIALSLSDNQMALLQGPALALPVILAAVPLGLLIDRHTRVRLFIFFAALQVIGSALTAVASDFVLLFAARCLVGLGQTAIVVTGFSLLADLYPPAERGRAKAMLVLGQYGGTSLAFAAGGALLAQFPSEEGWRWALLWLTGPPLILATLLVLAIREPPRIGIAHPSARPRRTFTELWRHRATVVPLMLGVVLAEVPVFALMTWAAPTFARNFTLAPDRVGAILGVAMIVSGLAGPVAGGALADWCQGGGGPRRTITALIFLSLACAPASFFAVTADLHIAAGLLVFCVTGVAAAVAMGVTLFTIVIPNELRGLCLSILAAAVSIFGIAVAPVAVSLLSGALGGPAAIGQALTCVCMAGCLLCAATLAWGRSAFPGVSPA